MFRVWRMKIDTWLKVKGCLKFFNMGNSEEDPNDWKGRKVGHWGEGTLRVMKCVAYGRFKKNEGKNWKSKLVAIAPGWWQRHEIPIYCNEHRSENMNSTTVSAGGFGCFVFHFLYVWVFCLCICSTPHACCASRGQKRGLNILELVLLPWGCWEFNLLAEVSALNGGAVSPAPTLVFWARVPRGNWLWTHYTADIGFEVLILLPLPSQLKQAWATTSGLEEKI